METEVRNWNQPRRTDAGEPCACFEAPVETGEPRAVDDFGLGGSDRGIEAESRS